MSYNEQIAGRMSQPYMYFQALKPSQGRTGSPRLKILPTMGRERGPGGSGGCEWLLQYVRHQLKPASTTADVAK
jgi:hypothetical protein